MKQFESLVFIDKKGSLRLPLPESAKKPSFYSVSRRNDGILVFAPLEDMLICRMCRCAKSRKFLHPVHAGFVCTDCLKGIRDSFEAGGYYTDASESSATAVFLSREGEITIPEAMRIDPHFKKITTETPIQVKMLKNGAILAIPLPEKQQCLRCGKEECGKLFLTPLGYICFECAELLYTKYGY